MPDWAELDPMADLGFHAIPATMLTLDLLFLSPPWTITAIPSFILSGVLAFSYWLWIEHCYSHNGWYPYPLFTALTTPQRTLLFVFSALVFFVSTATLKWLYGRVNGYGVSEPPRARPGKVKA
ncbi:hypothetical protein MMC20_002985 [Loxospora ochrophaea]|nr:hypothetical protein [Loxospora ochrophaea]